ncbi:MAG: hypothetical protein Q9N68_04275 [Gammaproteobacteria bacterium]|nr:hypothetical protein [Gammaproteobacteria bacterium]
MKNNKTSHPQHCFCQISAEELWPWIEKRYQHGISTIELLNSTDDPHQQELISIVALLDVDDDTLLQAMKNVPLSEQHILACRESVKALMLGSHSDYERELEES